VRVRVSVRVRVKTHTGDIDAGDAAFLTIALQEIRCLPQIHLPSSPSEFFVDFWSRAHRGDGSPVEILIF
jgi:hypothetical protein